MSETIIATRVACLSDNTNSFGYHGVMLVAEDGRCFEALWNIGRGEPRPQRGQFAHLRQNPSGTVTLARYQHWSFDQVLALTATTANAEVLSWAGWEVNQLKS